MNRLVRKETPESPLVHPTKTVTNTVRKFFSASGDFRWRDVPRKSYKEDGTHFKLITRQTLFSGDSGGDGDAEQPCELRYFEIGEGGHSTLERHVHTHAVLILRGRGRVLVGDEISDVEAFDLVHVPSRTWHQFRADQGEALGFLCQVPCDRDRPMRPDSVQRQELLANAHVAEFARF